MDGRTDGWTTARPPDERPRSRGAVGGEGRLGAPEAPRSLASLARLDKKPAAFWHLLEAAAAAPSRRYEQQRRISWDQWGGEASATASARPAADPPSAGGRALHHQKPCTRTRVDLCGRASLRSRRSPPPQIASFFVLLRNGSFVVNQ